MCLKCAGGCAPSRDERDRRARKVDGVAARGPSPPSPRSGSSISRRILDPLLQCAHGDVGIVGQRQDGGVDGGRIDQRLVALDVHDQFGVCRRRPPRPRGRCRRGGRSGSCARGAPKRRASAKIRSSSVAIIMLVQVSRLRGPFAHVLQHGFAGDGGESFAGKTGGGEPGRNNAQNFARHRRSYHENAAVIYLR